MWMVLLTIGLLTCNLAQLILIANLYRNLKEIKKIRHGMEILNERGGIYL